MKARTRVSMLLLVGVVQGACHDAPVGPPEPTEADLRAQVASSAGLVRTTWPSAEDPGPPFYARMDHVTPVFVADGWAVIAFYRDPDCIPADFNLLAFFDPPIAFGCELTVEGSSLYQGEALVGAPKVAHTQGTGAVPFWFIPAGAVLEAIGDGVLTIGELAALPGRMVGNAIHFNELLHPNPLPPFLGGGGHPNPKLILDADGVLADGRRFKYHVTRLDPEIRTIRLRFQ